ncbi:helix-turn-helix transcriptional regulator [Streptomyces rubradiris]|uniref:helix-turn-helix domain-containing protein n=1 Tax=Streptomyces rubradiris TaxID=285531 RepID=UPI0033D57841
MLAQVSSLPVPALPLEAIRHYVALQRDLDDFIAVAVRSALDRGADWADISAVTAVSVSSLKSRYAKTQVARIVKNRAQRRPTFAAPATDASAVPDCESPELPSTAKPTPRDRSHAALSRALSHLHRHSGRTVRQVALWAGISPSYVYRIMSGERFPTWSTVQRFARACDADPGNLLDLWCAANGIAPDPDQPFARALARFVGALRGMYLAQGRPPLTLLAGRLGAVAPGELRVIAALLTSRSLAGAENLSWAATAALTKVMNGDVTRARVLWQAVHQRASRPPHGTA